MPTIIESNCETREITERELTPEEIALILSQQSESLPTDKP